jgi:hypothetical protein
VTANPTSLSRAHAPLLVLAARARRVACRPTANTLRFRSTRCLRCSGPERHRRLGCGPRTARREPGQAAHGRRQLSRRHAPLDPGQQALRTAGSVRTPRCGGRTSAPRTRRRSLARLARLSAPGRGVFPTDPGMDAALAASRAPGQGSRLADGAHSASGCLSADVDGRTVETSTTRAVSARIAQAHIAGLTEGSPVQLNRASTENRVRLPV